jgi:hypothetical protein
LHPDAVPTKEHIERHGPPDVLIDLPNNTTTITIHLRQQLRKHARLLHLESSARLKPHFSAIRKWNPTTDEPTKLPRLLAPSRPPKLRKADQPIAVRQFVFRNWPIEP